MRLVHVQRSLHYYMPNFYNGKLHGRETACVTLDTMISKQDLMTYTLSSFTSSMISSQIILLLNANESYDFSLGLARAVLAPQHVTCVTRDQMKVWRQGSNRQDPTGPTL